MPIEQKPIIKSYLCTAYDDTQFITSELEYETEWLEKANVRFPGRGPLLAKKFIWVPEYSIAYGVSWKPLEQWVAVKEFIEI